jgi:hypothetical protein
MMPQLIIKRKNNLNCYKYLQLTPQHNNAKCEWSLIKTSASDLARCKICGHMTMNKTIIESLGGYSASNDPNV